jgi:hypothetical protein
MHCALPRRSQYCFVASDGRMTTRQLIGGTVLLLVSALPMQARGQLARLRGRVFDSVAALPLAGARVQLVDAEDRARIAFSTTSDSLGRFVVDSVARGHYIAGFLHPMLDSLGVVLAQRSLVVDNVGEMRLELAVPAPERLEVALCGKTSEKDSLGVVLGYILNAHSFAPIDDATVVAQWAEFAIGESHVSRTLLYRTTRTGAEGWFALCGVPAGSSVILRAVTGSDTSGAVEVEVPKSRVARRTLYVDHAPALVASLHGWVRTEDGVPIPGARVGIFSSDIIAVTDGEGEFELTGVPGGTQTLITRAIGFVPDERAVDLTDHHYAITVGLLALRRFLDTVHVRADRNSFISTVGFEDRRKGGAGRFFTAADVERLHPQELSDLLRHTPLLDLSTDNAHNVKIRVRGDQVACTPAIFVDGKQLVYWEIADLNSLIQPDELVGMEVYSAAMTPAEFRTKNSCGTLIVWTRTPERLHSRR